MSDVTWHLLATHPRQERRVEERLRKLGHATLLLQRDTWVRRRQRRIKASEVLFPGYLFLGFRGKSRWNDVRDCWGVCRVIYADGAPAVVQCNLVADLQSAMMGGLFDPKVEPDLRFENGKEVRITAGPFVSFIGLVDALVSHDRVRVLAELFGRKTVVEVGLDQIETA